MEIFGRNLVLEFHRSWKRYGNGRKAIEKQAEGDGIKVNNEEENYRHSGQEFYR